MNQIEVNSVMFEEVNQEMAMMVDEGPSMCALAFAQHALHKKRSIHVPISLQGIEATTLIDCGAIDNFINMPFMRKRGIRPKMLETPKTCRVGEGVTRVTHSFRVRQCLQVGDSL